MKGGTTYRLHALQNYEQQLRGYTNAAAYSFNVTQPRVRLDSTGSKMQLEYKRVGSWSFNITVNSNAITLNEPTVSMNSTTFNHTTITVSVTNSGTASGEFSMCGLQC